MLWDRYAAIEIKFVQLKKSEKLLWFTVVAVATCKYFYKSYLIINSFKIQWENCCKNTAYKAYVSVTCWIKCFPCVELVKIKKKKKGWMLSFVHIILHIDISKNCLYVRMCDWPFVSGRCEFIIFRRGCKPPKLELRLLSGGLYFKGYLLSLLKLGMWTCYPIQIDRHFCILEYFKDYWKTKRKIQMLRGKPFVPVTPSWQHAEAWYAGDTGSVFEGQNCSDLMGSLWWMLSELPTHDGFSAWAVRVSGEQAGTGRGSSLLTHPCRGTRGFV